MRQTNVIWVCWIGGCAFVGYLTSLPSSTTTSTDKNIHISSLEEYQTTFYQHFIHQNSNITTSSSLSTFIKSWIFSHIHTLTQLIKSMFYFESRSIHLIKVIGSSVQLLFPFFIPILGFLVFIFWFNDGSIVVGDKDSHKPTFHLSQICYFVVMVGGMVGVLQFKLMWRTFVKKEENEISLFDFFFFTSSDPPLPISDVIFDDSNLGTLNDDEKSMSLPERKKMIHQRLQSSFRIISWIVIGFELVGVAYIFQHFRFCVG